MADERTSAEELISELSEASREWMPDETAVFDAEARDELSAYRQMRKTAVVERAEETVEVAAAVFIIPRQYAERAEVFIVFEVFVRYFIDPIAVAAEIPNLLAEIDDSVQRLGFARFGEEARRVVSIRESVEQREDAASLINIAEDLGRDLFGERFRPSDFWGVPG